MQGIALAELRNGALEARMAQFQQPLAAIEERCPVGSKGEPARVIDENIRRKPMSPAASPRPKAKIHLFAIAPPEHLRIQFAYIAQAIPAQVHAKAHPDGNVCARARMHRGGEHIQLLGFLGPMA